MKWFENRIFNKCLDKPAYIKMWLKYVDSTFVIWPNRKEQLDKCLHQLKNKAKSVKFDIETEILLLFLNIVIKSQEPCINVTMCSKPIHLGQYIHKLSNYLVHGTRSYFILCSTIRNCFSENGLDSIISIYMISKLMAKQKKIVYQYCLQ